MIVEMTENKALDEKACYTSTSKKRYTLCYPSKNEEKRSIKLMQQLRKQNKL